MEQLIVVSNHLNGTLPPEYGGLTSLLEFNFTNNEDISGIIPTELFKLTRLQRFDAGGNRLHGQLSPLIFNWTSIISLNISNNCLTGRFPQELFSLSALKRIELNKNSLSGAFLSKNTLASKTLQYLDVFDNKLTGSLSDNLCDFSSLEFFDVGYNSISGQWPECIGKLR